MRGAATMARGASTRRKRDKGESRRYSAARSTFTESEMRVGVPKEIKNHEYRVGLTPASVAELTSAGHEVIVETRAGLGIDFSDEDYVTAGARILPSAA